MGSVGKERERKGDETPAYALEGVIAENLPEKLCQHSQSYRKDDICQIRFARYQEQGEDEAVQGGRRTEAADDAARVQVDERENQREEGAHIGIAGGMNQTRG